jgi:UDP-N-acetylmuramoyl-L-alanyl-D-glutamate--2,6-diaminopimelate ligase
MRLATLIEAVRPGRVIGAGDPDVTSVTYRVSDVEPGSLHVCIPGFKADGHDFAAAAVESGAAALVVERELPLAVPQLVVASSRAAMGPAADAFFGHPSRDLEVVGVTGTNGKTTTAFLMYAVLGAAGRRPGLLGTVESRIGGQALPVVRTTPEAVDLQATFRGMLDAGDRSCAMEVSSHALELERVAATRFAAAGFTNLTQDHLDFHPTMEDYFLAKRRLFVDGGPPAAVNIGDSYGRRLAGDIPDRLVTYARSGDEADVRPHALEIGEGGGIALIARTPRGLLPLDVRLRGGFNVENVLCVVALAELLDLPHAAVREGIAAVPGVPGRFEAVDVGQPFTVLVDYAHTPDSLDNVLRAARDITGGRLICVFGCGGDRDRGKRPMMGAVARRLADWPIVTTDNPRSEDPAAIIEEITAGVTMDTELDREAAIARAVDGAQPGDVVVIAGKGHEQGQQFADRTLPFDDRDVARAALEALSSR